MKFFLEVFFFSIVLSVLLAPCKSNSVDYSSFSSINELIEFETSEILNADVDDYQELSERYLYRAESYLLSGQYSLAFSDFKISSELAFLSGEKNGKSILFQSLFGQAIIYGCNEMLEEFQVTMDSLKAIVDSYPCLFYQECNTGSAFFHEQSTFIIPQDTFFPCENCNISKYNSSVNTRSQVTMTTLSSCNEKFFILSAQDLLTTPPIYGPDRVSIRECIEFAQGTTRKCRYLISLVPKAEVRVVLNIIIDDLENRAINCCKAGGVWKACLQPLVNKWYLWNQKWQAFSIPPDPAWD